MAPVFQLGLDLLRLAIRRYAVNLNQAVAALHSTGEAGGRVVAGLPAPSGKGLPVVEDQAPPVWEIQRGETAESPGSFACLSWPTT